jgi:hypothetical protein
MGGSEGPLFGHFRRKGPVAVNRRKDQFRVFFQKTPEASGADSSEFGCWVLVFSMLIPVDR